MLGEKGRGASGRRKRTPTIPLSSYLKRSHFLSQLAWLCLTLFAPIPSSYVLSGNHNNHQTTSFIRLRAASSFPPFSINAHHPLIILMPTIQYNNTMQRAYPPNKPLPLSLLPRLEERLRVREVAGEARHEVGVGEEGEHLLVPDQPHQVVRAQQRGAGRLQPRGVGEVRQGQARVG